MPSLLVHVTCGPESPTKAALALFVAAAAVEVGHDVHVFLAGDAVQLIREPVRSSLVGLGTGALREHFEKVIAGGGRLYLSAGSCAARGISDADLEGIPHEKAGPPMLVRLIMDCDRNIVY
ncbi:DsrE family protein [Microvirga roseola]|uniref:DsrE family protein n=1 Tax=Microvirga roseola TaxID=2883126 RepID=UPI001E45E794|nr:DsrE family protein [Microvirga roseola]